MCYWTTCIFRIDHECWTMKKLIYRTIRQKLLFQKIHVSFYTAFHLNKRSWRVASFSQQWDRGAETSLLLQGASWDGLTASTCLNHLRAPFRPKRKSLQPLQLKLPLIVPLLWHLPVRPWGQRSCTFSLSFLPSLVSASLYPILSSPQPWPVSR